MDTQAAINVLSFLTLASNAFVLIVFGALAIFRLKKSSSNFGKKLEKIIIKYSLLVALTISLFAILGSLYFSEIEKLEPCKLCWFQRIFMYPLPIILVTAQLFKLKEAFNYVIPLALIGSFIAGYQYYYQLGWDASASCSIVGLSASCSERFFTYYGYITIPWMSLSAFVYIFLLGLIGRRSN